MIDFPQQALATLGPIGNNERHLRDLADHLTHLVPFVGAGFSIPLGYPSWGNLLLSLAPNDAVRAEVQKRLLQYQYEEAAEAVASLPHFQAQLVAALHEDQLPRPIPGAPARLAARGNNHGNM